MIVFCKQCRAQVDLPEGMTKGFCGECGSPVEAEITQTSNAVIPNESSLPAGNDSVRPQTFESYAGSGIEVPVRAKRKLPLALILALSAVLVIGGVTAAAMMGAFGNGSYKSAEKLTLTMFNALAERGDVSEKGQEAQFEFSYKTSADIMNEMFGGSYMQINLSEVTAKGSAQIMGEQMAANINFSFNDLAFNLLGALTEDGYYLAYPGITDYYEFTPTQDEDEEEHTVTLDRKALKITLENIENAYFELTDRIQVVTKGVEITGGGITVKADEYELDFKQQDVIEFLRFVVSELRLNDNLIDYAVERSSIFSLFSFDDPQDLLDEMEDALDEYYDYSEDEDTLDKTLFRMTAAVSKGVIVSRTIDRIGGRSGNSISYDVLFNAKTAYLKGTVKAGGETMLKLTGEAAKDGGAWNGELKLDVSDYTSLKITGENVTYKNDIATGKFKVKATADDETAFSLNFDFSDDNGTQVGSVSGKVSDYDIGELTYRLKLDTIDSIDMPEFDEEYEINKDEIYGDEELYERYREMQDEIDTFFSEIVTYNNDWF
jgi:hypothetical protein